MYAAVTAEAGQLLGADHTGMCRYEPDGAVVAVAAWSTVPPVPVPVGTRWSLSGQNVTTLVFQTGRPARVSDYASASGAASDVARGHSIRSAVGVPISGYGRLWGVIFVSSRREEQLPADTEARLAGFAELVATALASAQARTELRGFAEEQAALRRVATLVARAAPPEVVLAAVAAEAGRLLGCDFTLLNRYNPDGRVSVVGAWSGSAHPVPLPVGSQVHFDGRNVTTQVYRTHRPARMDGYGPEAGAGAAGFAAAGITSSVGAPISVASRLWGVMIAMTRDQPLPADTEARLAGFTELVATAIANAQSQAELTASRARIVATADETRRRIERDLHDGVQQRVVSLTLQLRAAQAAVPPELAQLQADLDGVAAGLTGTLDELREYARGIHPAILAELGLAAALRALARRSPVPVKLDIREDTRPPERIEVTAYFVVSEALANAAKHANASAITVLVEAGENVLVCIRDDGAGGADPARGSGLTGLKDRVEATGGTMLLESHPGEGTSLIVELPAKAGPPPNVA
jgi:signal transduction histidine kinase